MSKVNLYFIIDSSGSMANKKSDVEGGFKSFIDELKGDGNDYSISVTLFNTTVWEAFRSKSLDEAQLVYNPMGGTALLKAIQDTLNRAPRFPTVQHTCNECGSAKEGEPIKNIVVIMTDGEENSSGPFYSKASVKRLIEDRQGLGTWTFVFLGADVNAFDEATSIGIPMANTVQYSGHHHHDMYRSAAYAVSATASSGLPASTNMAGDFDLGAGVSSAQVRPSQNPPVEESQTATVS